MTEQHGDTGTGGPSTIGGARTTSTVGVRTNAFLGLALALAGLMGGGVVANAVFYLLLDSTGYSTGTGNLVLQGLPSLVMGLVGAALGWSASASADDVAVPVGRTALVLGVLAALGAVVMVLAPQL